MEDCGHIPVWTDQRVERTNARGRHTYCAPFKAWIIEQALQPGMSMAGLAMRNQVNANQLRRWVTLHRRGAGAEATTARLLPVTIASHSGVAPETTCCAGAPVEIELGSAVVRVRDGVAPATLRLVLEALRGTTS
jgi:transposase-like protein